MPELPRYVSSNLYPDATPVDLEVIGDELSIRSSRREGKRITLDLPVADVIMALDLAGVIDRDGA